MTSNIERAEHIISQLVKIHGIKTFCVCPGSRNAPLVSVLSKAKGVDVLYFFEERSAAFFALGRSRREKRACAVLTTSGTAAAELLPAVVEAYYSNTPLALITADRPSFYRKARPPQTIIQPGIFSHYVEKTWDLTAKDKGDISGWRRTFSCHINICFDEPLIDSPVKKNYYKPSNFKPSPGFKPNAEKKDNTLIKNFFLKTKKPLVLLCSTPTGLKKDIESFLLKRGWPIYAEALSGLRESKKLQPLILKSGEKLLPRLVKDKKIDGVIFIGSSSSTRFARDLESFLLLPVLTVSKHKYSALSRKPQTVCFKSFFKWKSFPKPALKLVWEINKKQIKKLKNLIHQYPLSEASFIQKLSQKIKEKSFVFLGNSLPIREWNRSALYQDKSLQYMGNRGANGIDGLMSSFLGAVRPEQESWCLIGDLSFLYDLTAPWALKQAGFKAKCFFVVVNNGGGQIFSRLFKDKVFLNSHSLNFKSIAKLWGLNYYSIKKPADYKIFNPPALIEIQVSATESKYFERDYKKSFF